MMAHILTKWERLRIKELRMLLDANERIPDAFPTEDRMALVPPIVMLLRIAERVIHTNHTSCFEGCDTLNSEQPAQTEYHRAADRTCEKAQHGERGGYLHAADDDSPYDVDGCSYCGRCHHAIDARGMCSARQPAQEADPDPDEVRRVLGPEVMFATADELRILRRVARAWLKSPEQQPAPANPLSSFDARDWGREFCRIADGLGHKGIDEGWMISWFANALMRGWDEHASRYPEQQPAPTIAQVAEACGKGDGDVLSLWKSGLTWYAHQKGIDKTCSGDTPEAALRALYDDAVKKLQAQRDEAAAKLERLKA